MNTQQAIPQAYPLGRISADRGPSATTPALSFLLGQPRSLLLPMQRPLPEMLPMPASFLSLNTLHKGDFTCHPQPPPSPLCILSWLGVGKLALGVRSLSFIRLRAV